jgi:hypothetical protein
MNNEIKQILPDIFFKEIELREAICAVIEKNKTRLVVEYLKEQGLSGKIVYIKNTNENKNEDDYSFGKFNNAKNLTDDGKFYKIDLSFLKLIKPSSDNKNIVFVSFIDVLIIYNFST